MSEDLTQKIWNKGQPVGRELSVREIELALQREVRGHSLGIQVYIWTWLVILLATVVVAAVDIVGYSSNPLMLAVQVGITLLALTFGFYGIHLLREIHIMDRGAESMIVLLQRRQRFCRTKFEIWNFMMAGTIFLLTFAVTSCVDNDRGHYSIGRPWLFITFSLVQMAFMYGVAKIAQYPILRVMTILLADLEASAFEGTQSLPKLRRRWRRWATIFFIIGFILLLFGIWRGMQFHAKAGTKGRFKNEKSIDRGNRTLDSPSTRAFPEI